MGTIKENLVQAWGLLPKEGTHFLIRSAVLSRWAKVKFSTKRLAYFVRAHDIIEYVGNEHLEGTTGMGSFEPFDRVLVRDNNTEAWRVDIFSHMTNGKYHGMLHTWNQCIPYEGNEHRLGQCI